MQKLVIKHQFMGVKPCEIELHRFLLLIGEQASGKSTIAKLIYFFQTLPDAIYDNTVLADNLPEVNIKTIVSRRFSEIFGSNATKVVEPNSSKERGYHIFFHYSPNQIIEILNTGPTFVKFERPLLDAFNKALVQYFSFRKLDEEIDEKKARIQLRRALDVVFNRETNEHNYLIAGRSTVVAYNETAEKIVDEELSRLKEEEIRKQDFFQIRGNLHLLYQFVKWSEEAKKYFRDNGGAFSEVTHSLDHKNDLEIIAKIAKEILKGDYRISVHAGEQIKIQNSNIWVPISDASSGQQEVLRILQCLFLAIGLRNRQEFIFMEEPEAHLYPLAQKEVINAFAVFLNAIPHGKVVMTTHSPYILACINILLLAHFVSQERGGNGIDQKIAQAAIPKEYWLDPADFSAYAIGHSTKYCQNIKDDVTGLIAENYLDGISEVLGMQYQQLYDLLTLENA